MEKDILAPNEDSQKLYLDNRRSSVYQVARSVTVHSAIHNPVNSCTSCIDSIGPWLVFFGICWAEFGMGFNWLSQTAIKKQTLIYYGQAEEGYLYRILNEIWLYT
jgi:hypothetical protein